MQSVGLFVAGALRETFLRALHRRMFDQVWAWAGKYRLSDENIGVPRATIAVATRELCANAEYWIEHGTYSWTELGARFHHRLVQIHPFANGNGRHARLMTDVILHAHGQELFSWGSGDPLAAGGARVRYIAALRAADGHDFQPLLAFVRS